MSTPRDPAWEQRPGERPNAYAAFRAYRDQPDAERGRTVVGAWRSLTGRASVAPGYFREWAKRYEWGARAAAWDAEQDRLMLLEQAKASKAMVARHATQAQGYAALLTRPMQELLRRLDRGELVFEQMQQRDLLELAIVGARVWPRVAMMERLSRGEPTELVEAQAWTGPAADVREDDERMAAVYAALEEAGVRPEPERPAERQADVLQLPRRTG